MERSGREDQVRVEERLQPRRLAGVGGGEHSEQLPFLPHLLHPLQLSEPLLQEGDGGVEDGCVGAILPAHHLYKLKDIKRSNPFPDRSWKWLEPLELQGYICVGKVVVFLLIVGDG